MSEAKIFLVNQGKKELTPMTETTYAAEDDLQAFLARYPDLLPGDQIGPENPRRWLLVSRELSVPSTSDGGGRQFSLDHPFLAQEALQLRVGQTQAFTFLFDMNVLFERFVAGFLRRHRHDAVPDTLQTCDILVQGRGVSRWLARIHPVGGRGVFRLKPDILLRRPKPDGTIALVVDTKYKAHPTIKESDAYQMHAYATQYDCPDVLLLYPKAQMALQTLYINKSEGEPPTRLRARTVSLRYDLSAPAGRNELAGELAQAMEGE